MHSRVAALVLVCALCFCMLPAVAAADQARHVAAGYLHTCAVTAAGGVSL